MCISYSKYKTGHISHALHDQREQLVDIPKPSSSPVQRTSALHASITTSNTRFMLLVWSRKYHVHSVLKLHVRNARNIHKHHHIKSCLLIQRATVWFFWSTLCHGYALDICMYTKPIL